MLHEFIEQMHETKLPLSFVGPLMLLMVFSLILRIRHSWALQREHKATKYDCQGVHIRDLDSLEYTVEMPLAVVPGGNYMCVVATHGVHSSLDFRRRILHLASFEVGANALLQIYEQRFKKDEFGTLVPL